MSKKQSPETFSDSPENHFRQPFLPNSPDPSYAFPLEFPCPDPDYNGPFVVIDDIASSQAAFHEDNHPDEPADESEASDSQEKQ
jgi:hypothetical protein